MSGPVNNTTQNIKSYNQQSDFGRLNSIKPPRFSGDAAAKSPEKNSRPETDTSSRTTYEHPEKNPTNLHDVAVRYSTHKETGKTVIKIVDKESNEVIREIPSREDLERSARLKMYVGKLLDAMA